MPTKAGLFEACLAINELDFILYLFVVLPERPIFPLSGGIV
jgi:hypothetical protein